MTLNGESINGSQEGSLVIEQFLSENYLFRRNILNDKVEFVDLRVKSADGQPVWKALTEQETLSIVIRAKREHILDDGSPKTEIMEYVKSAEVPIYNPIAEFLNNLPEWDGQNHVAKLLNRIPGLSTEMHNYMAIWLRATVAHWLQMDMLHGKQLYAQIVYELRVLNEPYWFSNADVARIQELNLANKFDRDMALWGNLLVNLDEMDSYSKRQHTALKQILSLNKVNARQAYGRTQQDRPRFASFVATTNNPHPLSDVTGSRRFLCFTIPEGKFIDNEQLYAQIVYELRVLNEPYWFSNADVARIQELNLEYMDQKDIAEILSVCIRKPKEGEIAKKMSSTELLNLIRKEYPSVPNTQSSKVCLGTALRKMGYDHKNHNNLSVYEVVPIKAA